jgi:predicted transcriptional regulator
MGRTRKTDPVQNSVTVYGHVDRATADALDRIADQMLMPRSWVVSQILKEWAERRSIEVHALEVSWNESTREQLAKHGLETPVDPSRISV